MINKIRQFLDSICQRLISGSHTRFGVIVIKSPEEPKSVGIMFVFEELWPEASKDAYDGLLWMTPYPFVSLNDVAISLREMRAKWGPNIGDAINGEMADFDRIWKETQPQRESWENEGGAIK